MYIQVVFIPGMKNGTLNIAVDMQITNYTFLLKT